MDRSDRISHYFHVAFGRVRLTATTLSEIHDNILTRCLARDVGSNMAGEKIHRSSLSTRLLWEKINPLNRS